MPGRVCRRRPAAVALPESRRHACERQDPRPVAEAQVAIEGGTVVHRDRRAAPEGDDHSEDDPAQTHGSDKPPQPAPGQYAVARRFRERPRASARWGSQRRAGRESRRGASPRRFRGRSGASFPRADERRSPRRARRTIPRTAPHAATKSQRPLPGSDMVTRPIPWPSPPPLRGHGSRGRRRRKRRTGTMPRNRSRVRVRRTPYPVRFRRDRRP